MKNYRSIAALLWVVFTDSLGWGIAFSVFAPLILSEHSPLLSASVQHASRATLYEFLLAIYSLFMFFFAPVIGGISDRFGRKPALQISMIGLTIGFLLCAAGCLWESFILLVFGRIVSGMTAASLSVAQAAVVDISTAETKASYLSILVLANCLGFSLGPLLGGVLEAYHFGPIGMTTFLAGALMSTVGLFAISFLFRETYQTSQLKGKINILKEFVNIKEVFCKPILNRYLLSFLFSMVAYGLFFSNLPVFLTRQFQPSSSLISVILSGFMIILSFSLIVAGKYIFRVMKEGKVVFLTQCIQLVIYFFIAFCVDSLPFNIFLFLIIALTIAQTYIGLLTLISNAATKDWQGRVMGVVASLFALTWGVGPILASVWNHVSIGAPFFCSAFLVLFAFIVFPGLRESRNNTLSGITRKTH